MNLSSNSPESHLLKQLKFGRYQVVKLLGEGAMGRVYLAQDPVLDRLVALKIIALEHTVDEEKRHEFFERFTFEARASAKLNHPSIVTIHDAGNDNGTPWIAFEFVKGQRLDQQLRAENRFSFKKTRTICTQLASALNYAHESRIIHRDIKPQNILVDERTHIAKLADFGVAKAPWTGMTREGNSVGSPGYMSPEQIDGTSIDTRSDLFSLGIVIYEMLTGKHPFLKESIPATFYATLNCIYTPIADIRPDAPESLIALVNGLLRADRVKRIQSASNVLSLVDTTAATVTKLPSQVSVPASSSSVEKNVNTIQLFWKIIAKAVLTYMPPLLKSIRAIALFILNNFFRSLPGIRTFIWTHRNLVFKGVMVIIPLCLIPFVLKPSCNHERKKVSHSGNTHVFNLLASDVDKQFSEKNFDSIEIAVSEYVKQHGENNDVQFVQARIALKRQDYAEALELMGSIAGSSGARYFNKHKKLLLNDIEILFREGEAATDLVTICAEPLKPVITSSINNWLESSHYWVRWNAISVCKQLNRKVDMVNVYILDLQTAASIRTRIRAAEKLGELGDRRAIKPLQEISQRGFRDPFVSTAAGDVLEQYFKK